MIFAGGGLANVDGGRHRMPKGVDAMLNRFTQLRRKEVINLCDGCRLGCVGDVEVKLPEGEVRALIVFGPCRFSDCSAGERTITYRGNAYRNSGTTSSSSTSPSGVRTARLTANEDAGDKTEKMAENI